MRMRFMTMAAVAVALSTAGGARAQDAGVTSDLRCFLVSSIGASSVDGGTKASLAYLAAYYLGRLDGRTPKVDLETLVPAEMAKLSPEDYRPELLRCGAEARTRREAVSAIGDRLRAKAGQ